jgi:UDPglucose 6-dehydrogenase
MVILIGLIRLMENNISILGIGKLGLCFALNLERSGFKVLGVDLNESYINSINNKSLTSHEKDVCSLLKFSKNLKATTDLDEALTFSNNLFVFVATPSLQDGHYDHSQIDNIVERLIERGVQPERKDLIIGCTVMPGYCDQIQKKLSGYNYEVSYNPEFIAQGTIIRDQLYPDMILIGSNSEDSAQKISKIYSSMILNSAPIHVMNRISAELCKISLNCFITTKIAFTNMIGDLSTKVGAEPDKILNAIGSDSRVGSKCMRYGFGYGGPCFPRDNRALGVYAKENDCSIHISDATDKCNTDHLQFMIDNFDGAEITLESVTYKPESVMIEESQQLAYAVGLARRGVKVTVADKPEVIDQVKTIYEDLLNYAKTNDQSI